MKDLRRTRVWTVFHATCKEASEVVPVCKVGYACNIQEEHKTKKLCFALLYEVYIHTYISIYLNVYIYTYKLIRIYMYIYISNNLNSLTGSVKVLLPNEAYPAKAGVFSFSKKFSPHLVNAPRFVPDRFFGAKKVSRSNKDVASYC